MTQQDKDRAEFEVWMRKEHPDHLMLRETPAFRPGRKGAQPTGCTSV